MEILDVKRNPTGNIYLLDLGNGFPVECVDAQDVAVNKISAGVDYLKLKHRDAVPLVPREEKWVIIISSQYGCLHNCEYCDVKKTGFRGNIPERGMWAQITQIINSHPEVKTCKKAKIHFARMGEPSWNARNVFAVMEKLPGSKPGFRFMPCFTTIAPKRNKHITEILAQYLQISRDLYGGFAQLQFSINSTNEELRQKIIGEPVMTGKEIASFAESHRSLIVGRKITLNFISAKSYETDSETTKNTYDPDLFAIKLTPVNTSESTKEKGIVSLVGADNPTGINDLAEQLRKYGYQVVVSVTAEYEDQNAMGCGQMAFLYQRDRYVQSRSGSRKVPAVP